jgi:glycolate dehydrogenase FAD-linked subunit
VHAGYPTDAAAVLLFEVDGLPAFVDAAVERIRSISQAHGARTVRVAADEAERQLLWKGRKSAFGAVSRIAPDYYLHDTVVPRTRLVEVLRRVDEIAAARGLRVLNVFHAGDGNLHPLLSFDARQPGVLDQVHAAGEEIVLASIDAGGVLSGEHGIGIEKRDLMGRMFSADDLDAQARVQEVFDPDGAANPGKVLPAGSRCGEVARIPAGLWV